MSSESVAGTPLASGDDHSMAATMTRPGQKPNNHGARPDEARSVPDQKALDGGHLSGAGGDTPSGADLQPGSRRSHPKSRTGCRTCKKRKIKCDEHKPCCRNCIKHAVRCDFLSSYPLSAAQGHGHRPLSSSPSPVPRHPGAGVSGSAPNSLGPGPSPGLSGLNMADLELMHNYTTLTFATLASEPCVREVLRTTVVRMGLRCNYLMRTVLAVSALHLAHYRKGDKKEAYVAMASRHYQAASQEAIPLMGRELDLTMENCENLFMFSRLTLYFALGCPRKEDATLLEGSIFPQWLFLSGGIDPIIKTLDPRNYEGPLKPFFAYGISRARLVMGEAKDDNPDSPLLSGLQASINKACASEPQLLYVYNKAISQLRHVLRLIMPAQHGRAPTAAAAAVMAGAGLDAAVMDLDGADGGAGEGASAEADRNPPQRLGKSLDSGDIFITIWMVARDFLPLLRGPDARQEAVAIFAHFLIILKKLEPQWWSDGWPEHLIERIWEMLDQEHRLWIQWPVEELGWVPP